MCVPTTLQLSPLYLHSWSKSDTPHISRLPPQLKKATASALKPRCAIAYSSQTVDNTKHFLFPSIWLCYRLWPHLLQTHLWLWWWWGPLPLVVLSCLHLLLLSFSVMMFPFLLLTKYYTVPPLAASNQDYMVFTGDFCISRLLGPSIMS